MSKLTKILTIGCCVFVAWGCAIHVGAHGSSGNLDSVFGGIDVESGAQVGNVSSVNGGIDIDSNATALKVDTVNGGIDIGHDVSIVSAETVNGGIDAGENLVVKNGLETVNGGIQLRLGSKVGKSIETVNGDIDLNNTVVEQDLKTVNGDITLENFTIIKGDLIIEKSGGWFSSMSNDKNVLVIDQSSTVVGTIHLYKKVKLQIEEGAKIGEIKEHFLRE